ncbi:FHA domain-containing protein FhaA [bacterium HR36]|nr:FHA domain-containing protein FhaA [bacterium HR36]
MWEVRISVLNAREPQAFVLRPPEVVIGRGRECDFRIRARDVSRRHCRIIFHPTHVAVEDLGSTNGTIVNGQPVTGSVALKSGDVIRLGSALLKVDFIGQTEAGAHTSSVSRAPLLAQSVEEGPASVFVKLGDQPPGGNPTRQH